eukprot:COSAG05_NODE_1863_length_3942_cov_2.381473_2_plen_70_part_00
MRPLLLHLHTARNLSTVAVSLAGYNGEPLNYTSAAMLLALFLALFVSISTGLSAEPEPKHLEWDEFRSA